MVIFFEIIMNKITLYHGTDARILEMTKEEREQYKRECNLVIDALFPLYKPLLVQEKVETAYNGQTRYVYEYPLKLKYESVLKEKGDEYMYINLLEKLLMIDAQKNGAELYQYKDLYLCSLKRSAMNYAQRSYAGGETGLIAYRLIKGAEIIGFDNMYNDQVVKQAAERIKEFAKEGNERPAIITIEGVDIKDLLREDGRPLSDIDLKLINDLAKVAGFKFRYTKPIELSKYKIELLNKELFQQIIHEEK